MKKGFTLIELLAVIVILAIIALIATPIILGIINDAREDANKRSVENYAHAVELAIARDATKKGGVIEPGIYEIVPDSLGKQIKKRTLVIDVDYKGEAITKGSIIVLSEEGKEGQIELSGIEFSNAKTKYNYSETAGVTKNESNGGGSNLVQSQYKVTDSGILLHYERQGNETSVKIPAEVNGVKIKSIAPGAFIQADTIGVVSGDSMIIVGLTEKANEIKDLAAQNDTEVIMIDEFLKRDNIEFNFDDISGSFMLFSIIDNNGEINLEPATDNLSNYYLTDVDLSSMTYLEELYPSSFVGFQGSSSSCYGPECKGNLKSVKLPMNANLKTISVGAFYNNQLTEVIIPNTVTLIDDYAFADNNLATIIIPEGVVKIGGNVFSGNNLTTITIPESIVEIGGYAFKENNITTAKVLGDSSRFDSMWSNIFDNTVQKVAG